jgi:D-alanine--poly(phosphoribitol) ligase subunit 1
VRENSHGAVMTDATDCMNFNLASPLREQALTRPEALALSVGDTSISYGELAALAQRISAWLKNEVGGRPARVGILASRSLEAYAGILGTIWSGAAYVPINPKTPEERLIQLFQITRLDALIVDNAGLGCLRGRVAQCCPRRVLAGNPGPELKACVVSSGVPLAEYGDLPEFDPNDTPTSVKKDDLAYIIFTSGTTGVPKGVMVTAGSVAQFMAVMQLRYGFSTEDRVSQASELTFDVSVFDMFMTWGAGSALYVVPEAQLMAPGKFIRDNRLTVWFSVPSIALFMQRMKMLTPGAFPQLRYSLFAGEPLPIASALAWQAAAPNSSVENLYGPTEATVVCIGQRLTQPPKATESRGILATGEPFDGVEAAVADADLKFLPLEKQGELMVAGGQLAAGYFEDSEMTSARFPVLNGKRWYRTGDLVYQDASGIFHHLGRIDNQVKVLGNRVELEEVEAHLREVIGADLVAAVAWPIKDGSAAGIVAFQCGSTLSPQVVREAMQKRVPSYMVPQQIREIEVMPLGSSGKIDRKALLRKLAGEQS